MEWREDATDRAEGTVVALAVARKVVLGLYTRSYCLERRPNDETYRALARYRYFVSSLQNYFVRSVAHHAKGTATTGRGLE